MTWTAGEFLTNYLHAIWWVALLAVCIAAAVAVLFGIAIEAMKPEPPAPPYGLELDDVYFTQNNEIDK